MQQPQYEYIVKVRYDSGKIKTWPFSVESNARGLMDKLLADETVELISFGSRPVLPWQWEAVKGDWAPLPAAAQ